MASTSKGWKQALLQSGVPLEYEVARLLAQAGLSVDADFGFIRPDGGDEQEGSVDIMSTWYSGDDIDFTIKVLVECKFRSPQKSFLFIPEPNIEYSPVTLGGTVNVIDQFSPFYVPTDELSKFEENFQFVYKGIEVFNGGAISNEIRHGINQLRYAMPVLLRRDINFQLGGHRDDIRPTFFAKILVVNVDIRILNEDCSIDSIKSANELDEISQVEAAVILHSNYGLDFEKYVAKVFSESDRIGHIARSLTADLRSAGKALGSSDTPGKFIANLQVGNTWDCLRMGSQFFVVGKDHLLSLVEELKVACSAAYKMRRAEMFTTEL